MRDPMYPEPDPSDGATTASAGESDTQSNDGGDASESAETFLAPKSALGGDKKVGDTITFKVVHCYTDECELEAVDSPDDNPDDETMEGAQGQLDSMATDQ